MTKKLGIEPAFPLLDTTDGMSKRFYAACAAMQGFTANPHPELIVLEVPQVVDWCYKLADELLKQEGAHND